MLFYPEDCFDPLREKNCPCDREKLLQVWDWRVRICNKFKITETIFETKYVHTSFFIISRSNQKIDLLVQPYVAMVLKAFHQLLS